MRMKIQLGKDSGHPHVPVMINDQGPFTFALDTGASATTISKSLADQLGIPTYAGKKAKASGIGGNQISVQAARLESFDVGSISFHDEEVGVIDLDAIFGSECKFGVIGYTTLRDYMIRVHYGVLEFKMQRSNGESDSDNVEWMPFKLLMNSHLVGVPVYINGKGPFDHILDTGSSGNVMTPAVASAIGVTDAMPEGLIEATGCSGGECVGVAGRAVGYGAMVRSITIGSAELNDAVMGVIDLGVVTPEGEKIDYGIIGYPFLKDYELTLDYPNHRFALAKHSGN